MDVVDVLEAPPCVPDRRRDALETAQSDAKSKRVLATDRLDGAWSFRESALHDPPNLAPEIFAVVRDESAAEQFALFSFHFPPGLDNSGFVGWLATELKRRLGTGVFVVCGQNSARGGVFDHWGCPVHLKDEALAVINELRGVH